MSGLLHFSLARSMMDARPIAGATMVDALSQMPQGHYRVIVVDPPWNQGKTGKRRARPNQGTELDYPTLDRASLLKLPIGQLAHPERAYLWLWATNSRDRSVDQPVLQVAMELMEHWGFRFYTMVTWDKTTGPCPFGPYQITTEYVLFGYRGQGQFPKAGMGKLQTGFRESPSGHSVKPDSFYRQVAEYFEGPRIDVFARQTRPGYDGWGDQYGKVAAPEVISAHQVVLN